MLEAIVSNDDNLAYGAIVTVQTENDAWITTLTDDGIGELKNMIADARRSPENWRSFLVTARLMPPAVMGADLR